MHYIALDIETCPLPLEGYSAQQQARLAREMQFRRQREPDMPEDMLAHWAASLHPLLSRIVCISVQRAENDPLQPNPPHSYLATEPPRSGAYCSNFGRICSALWNAAKKSAGSRSTVNDSMFPFYWHARYTTA